MCVMDLSCDETLTLLDYVMDYESQKVIHQDQIITLFNWDSRPVLYNIVDSKLTLDRYLQTLNILEDFKNPLALRMILFPSPSDIMFMQLGVVLQDLDQMPSGLLEMILRYVSIDVNFYSKKPIDPNGFDYLLSNYREALVLARFNAFTPTLERCWNHPDYLADFEGLCSADICRMVTTI